MIACRFVHKDTHTHTHTKHLSVMCNLCAWWLQTGAGRLKSCTTRVKWPRCGKGIYGRQSIISDVKEM